MDSAGVVRRATFTTPGGVIFGGHSKQTMQLGIAMFIGLDVDKYSAAVAVARAGRAEVRRRTADGDTTIQVSRQNTDRRGPDLNQPGDQQG